MYTEGEIQDATGFGSGDEFQSEAQVREYFTVASIRAMFSGECAQTQDELDAMAETVIAHHWHCTFGTARQTATPMYIYRDGDSTYTFQRGAVGTQDIILVSHTNGTESTDEWSAEAIGLPRDDEEAADYLSEFAWESISTLPALPAQQQYVAIRYAADGHAGEEGAGAEIARGTLMGCRLVIAQNIQGLPADLRWHGQFGVDEAEDATTIEAYHESFEEGCGGYVIRRAEA